MNATLKHRVGTRTRNPSTGAADRARRGWGQRACDRRAHLEAVDGEEPAEDALLESRAQHDHVVLLIHGGAAGPVRSPVALAKRKLEEG